MLYCKKGREIWLHANKKYFSLQKTTTTYIKMYILQYITMLLVTKTLF